jgi:hypothetical protein
MNNGKIPKNDILFLSYKNYFMEGQFNPLITKYNESHKRQINLYDLANYDDIKNSRDPKNRNNINVFFKKFDLISDETKKNELSYKEFENGGKWYLILDEAHKGDKEDSKRQAYYSVMTRFGFLFNFSATFTDPWDIITTVFDFDLPTYNKKGYGKNIYVSQQNLEAFKTSGTGTIEEEQEKENVVMKTLITLAMVKKAHNLISGVKPNIYHNPMMVLYGNTTNINNSDLYVFFKVLEEIALGKISEYLFEKLKKEVLYEFKNHPKFVFGDDKLPNLKQVEDISFKDVLNLVFNSDTPGNIEVIKIRNNKEELAFKLKTSDKYFASMKIGDISNWIKEKLSNYEINENPVESSFFKHINDPESTINIIMSSRSIYEGWDTNRPNVIVFINIGVGDARKYVMQSIGRGVRIKPLEKKDIEVRQRLQILANNGDSDANELLSLLIEKGLVNMASLLETLFVFGTSEKNINEIMKSIKFERQVEGDIINISKNDLASKYTLLLPVYKEIKDVRIKDLPHFNGNFDLLNNYYKWIGDERILYAIYSDETGPRVLEKLRTYLSSRDNFKNDYSGNAYDQMKRLLDHLNISLKEMDGFKEIKDEIIHFKEISVEITSDEDKKDLLDEIERVRKFKDPAVLKEELKKRYSLGEIGLDEYTAQIENLSKAEKKVSFKYNGSQIELINIAQHYYIPIILSASEKADFINHIIKVDSERQFIYKLDSFITSEEFKKLNVDWWMFSKIDESLDKVSIPYFDGNDMRNYYPDFIFWIKQGSNYKIVFVDPKSIKYSEYQNKVDYFAKLFEKDDKPKEFKYKDLIVKVYLFMRTEDDINKVGERYRKYWMDDLKKIFTVV